MLRQFTGISTILSIQGRYRETDTKSLKNKYFAFGRQLQASAQSFHGYKNMSEWEKID